jgi:vacuolar-type H+-ATPase subunit E/Vma4
METDKIREAILDKAKGEASKIIKDAEAKAREMISDAEGQKDRKFEEEKKKVITEANREASKTLAQASLKARQNILANKDTVINEVIAKVKEELAKEVKDKTLFERIIKEALDALESEEKMRLLVSSKDVGIVREVVGENGALKEKIEEVKEADYLGGVVVETIDGMVSIDNSFDMRLEMLMPKILPEIGKKLFGS